MATSESAIEQAERIVLRHVPIAPESTDATKLATACGMGWGQAVSAITLLKKSGQVVGTATTGWSRPSPLRG